MSNQKMCSLFPWQHGISYLFLIVRMSEENQLVAWFITYCFWQFCIFQVCMGKLVFIWNFSLPHFKIFETSIHNFWNKLKIATEPVDFQSLRVPVDGRKTQVLGKIFFLEKPSLESRLLRFRIFVKNWLIAKTFSKIWTFLKFLF
jgi:hypothetical protein